MDPLVRTFTGLADLAPEEPLVLSSSEQWTRSQVLERTQAYGSLWQAWLQEHSLADGTIVALRVQPGAGFLAAFLACRLAGICVLLLDDSLTTREVQKIGAELGAACLWNSQAVLDAERSFPDSVVQLNGRARLPGASCLKLTSGSSGDPAGVIIPPSSLHEDGWALIRSIGLEEQDRILAAVPMSHSYGLSVIASPAWLLGCTVVLPEAGDLLRAADTHDATFLPSVPGWFEAHLNSPNSPPTPASLRILMSAGSPLRPLTARRWFERYGQHIHVLYGSSECGGITYDRNGDAASRGSVGSAVDGVRVEIDEGGRVAVHSKATALGYWPADPTNDARLSPGRFQTEDLARREGAEFFLEGRRSQWINVKGNKVDPAEIEGVLHDHPDIQDAVVIAHPLPEGRGEVIRAIIACPTGAMSYQEILSWCRPRLARHKYPRSVVVVTELPRTARGKLDRQALASLG